jgi:hypothetical protein
MYEITITAVGEVRDADGNLISAEPVEAKMEVTADQLAELGLDQENTDG